MSRGISGETTVIKPSNNVYTVLSIIGTLVVLGGLAVLYMRSTALLGWGRFSPGGKWTPRRHGGHGGDLRWGVWGGSFNLFLVSSHGRDARITDLGRWGLS